MNQFRTFHSLLKINNSCVSVSTEAALFFKGPCVLLWILKADKATESYTYSLIKLIPVINKPEILAKDIHL
jgi:hypothetical protein